MHTWWEADWGCRCNPFYREWEIHTSLSAGRLSSARPSRLNALSAAPTLPPHQWFEQTELNKMKEKELFSCCGSTSVPHILFGVISNICWVIKCNASGDAFSSASSPHWSVPRPFVIGADESQRVGSHGPRSSAKHTKRPGRARRSYRFTRKRPQMEDVKKVNRVFSDN